MQSLPESLRSPGRMQKSPPASQQTWRAAIGRWLSGLWVSTAVVGTKYQPRLISPLHTKLAIKTRTRRNLWD